MPTDADLKIDLSHLATLSKNVLSEHISVIDNILSIFEESFSNNIRTSYVVVNINKLNFKIKLNDLFYSLLLQISRLEINDYKFNRDSFVFDVVDINLTMSNYFNYNITEFSSTLEIVVITKQIGKSLENLAKYAWEINYLSGNTVNVYDILKLSERNPEVREILNFHVNESAQYSEIEDSISLNNKRFVEILEKEDTSTCLTNMLPVINMGQFQQVFVNIGLKPDLYEEIIPRPINSSFLRGMNDSTDFFINAVGARKALIVNASQVRKAGYLSRKLALLLLATDLDGSVEDCGPRSLLPLIIDNEKASKRFINRFYKTKETSKKFKLITKENVGEILNNQIYIASPITCNLSSQNKVCKTCYGKMADLNNFHIGLTSMLILGEQFIQMLLSSKHLLRVISDFIELPGTKFKDYFEIEKNNIIVSKACKIKMVEYTDDEFSNNKLVNSLELYTIKDELIELIEFKDMDVTILRKYFNEEIDDELLIEFKPEDEVFKIDIQNNGLSVPLKKLLKLIESGTELNLRNSTSELVNDIIELLEESKIRLSGFGVELMVRELARNPDNIQEKTFEENNIEFLRLTAAIIESPAASISLAFQEYNRLLEGKLFNKNQSSPFDVLF